MTPTAFRKLALSLPRTEERQHMNHPDFRVGGKIFATLGYPDKTRGMVKLSPEGPALFFEGSPQRLHPGERHVGTTRRNQRAVEGCAERRAGEGDQGSLAQQRSQTLIK